MGLIALEISELKNGCVVFTTTSGVLLFSF